MHLEYRNPKVEKQCTDLKQAKKEFSEKVANKLFKLINYMISADSLADVTNYPRYRFHKLVGDLSGLYAIDIDGSRSPYRLIVSFVEEDVTAVFANPKSIKIIKVEEVSKHYGK